MRGFNELRFEDEKGEEEIFVHAQKDMNIGVRNNKNTHVNGFSHSQIAKNKTEIIMGHEAEFAKFSRALVTEGTMKLSAGSPSPVNPLNARLFNGQRRLDFDHRDLIRDTSSISTAEVGSMLITSKSDTAISAKGEILINGQKSISLSTAQSISQNSGDSIITTAESTQNHAAATQYIVSAGNEIIFKCGASELIMKKDGQIKMNGVNIDIKAGKICLN